MFLGFEEIEFLARLLDQLDTQTNVAASDVELAMNAMRVARGLAAIQIEEQPVRL